MGAVRKGVARNGSTEPAALRPSIPPTFFLAAGWWVASAIAFSVSGDAPLDCLPTCVVIAAACALALAVLLVRWRGRLHVETALLVALGCALGVSCGMLRSAELAHQELACLALPSGVYRIEARADARAGDFGPSCLAALRMPDGSEVAVTVRYPSDCGLVRYGSAYEARVRFSEISEGSKDYYRTQGIVAVATASDMQRLEPSGVSGHLVSFRERAIALFDDFEGRGAAFLRAILLGDRSALEDDGFYREVKAVGLAHIVAVSGAHLSIVCMLIGVALSALRVPRRVAVPLQALFVLSYLVCTGMPISGIRAAVMATVALSAVYARRRSSGLGALSVCVCCVLSLSPEAAVSVSFALSVLATSGIIVFGGLARDWCRAITGGRFGAACDSVALTASSGILTLPLSASVFAQLPLLSPLANLYALPAFALFCGGGLVVVGLTVVLPEIFGFALDGLVVAAQGFCEGIGLLARAPIASIPCDFALVPALAGSMAVAVVIWRAWPQPSRRALCTAVASIAVVALAAAIMAPALHRDSEIIMLDVGQGDAFVIRSKGASVLIDTGNQDARLLSALARNGVYALDAVVITHADDDHCASLEALGGVVRVERVCVAADLLACDCSSCTDLRASAESVAGSENLVGLEVGDALRVGSIELTAIWPEAFSDEGGNADSLSLLMECDADGDRVVDWTGLFCGDAEDAELDAMIAAGRLGRVDVYKVGHHGSKAAIDADTASVLAPSIGLVSAGENNRYGHPADQTLAVLEGAGASVYRTDVAGDVVCRMTADALEVETLR